MSRMDRRGFVRAGVAAGLSLAAVGPARGRGRAPAVIRQGTATPVVLSDLSGLNYKNGGEVSCVERAFSMMSGGTDVLESLVAGVNIPENDPEEVGIGYGGLPNADGVVQLDSCCIHGPKRRAGGVAALEGVRTPSLVARAVMEQTDHHLLVGAGAKEFARMLGFEIEKDLTTEKSRRLWLEWKRRVDPEHYLDPAARAAAGLAAGRQMLAEGLVDESHFWGTISCLGINGKGEICGVNSSSGLAWKIPGRVGDSPILGAGLYVENGIGGAGSTGRGEANLYGLSCYQIVDNVRRGMHPADAGLEALRRVLANTVEDRLLNARGEPAFNLRFFVVNGKGEHAGLAMYASGETHYAVCTEAGPEAVPFTPLLAGGPDDESGS